MQLTSLSIRRNGWKGFRKMASSNVSNTRTFGGRTVYLYKRNTLKKMELKWLYLSVFLRNKLIPGIFCSYYLQVTEILSSTEYFLFSFFLPSN